MKIVVIEACGLHLGYVGCYGNDWVATPNLDRLAAEGIVFDWHFVDQPELAAVTPWQNRSVGTGLYHPAANAAETSQPRVIRCESLTTFASEVSNALDANDPWLWIEGPSLLPPWRLDDELLEAYFDEDDIDEGLAPWIDPQLGIVTPNDAEILQLQNTYAAAVTVFDAQFGVVLEKLRATDALICVTARSGLPLGEHGMIGAPRPLLHDELVHVPLLMRQSGGAHAGLRVAGLTQPVDLLPTFLDSLSRPAPPMDGRSLWPLIRGEVDEIRPFAFASLRVGNEEAWLLRSPDWALHVPIAPAGSARQLFVKPDDRWEVNDLYQPQIEAAEALEQDLRAFAATIGAD